MQECGAHDGEDGVQGGQEPEECQPGHLPLRPASAGSLIAFLWSTKRIRVSDEAIKHLDSNN